MIIEVGERARDHFAGGGDVAGSVVTALVELTRARAGEGGVAQVLALADDRRAFADLGDPHRWSSLDQVVALFNAASLVTGDGAIALHVGERLVGESTTAEPEELADVLAEIGGPADAFGAIRQILAHFDATATAVVVELGDEHALIRVTPRPGTNRHAHLCEMTRGLLSSLPTLVGGPPAIVSESECAARGGRFCLYAATWEVEEAAPEADEQPVAGRGPDLGDDGTVPMAADAGASDPGDESAGGGTSDEPTPGRAKPTVMGDGGGTSDDIAPAGGPAAGEDVTRLASQLRQMGSLFDDALATSLELLDDDVEALLDHLASRVDSVVTDGPYVLMIRVGSGTPIHLHSRGLESHDAQALAADLWGEDPEHDDPARLVVDIASPRRRYGRLAVIRSSGDRPTPAASRMLDLYAAYAATALDIFVVLSDAKRHNSTARALLSFSDRLSRMTNLGEAVQLVVDVVPEVTGCDRATIYLWNDRVGHLVPRARTSGHDLGGPSAGVFAVTGHQIRTEVPARAPSGDAASGPVLPGNDPKADGGAGDDADGEVVTIPTNIPLMERLINRREVITIEKDVDDPALRRLLTDSGTEASVIAPLFTAGALMGTLSASFDLGAPGWSYRDPDVHERLAGLADQAATALQNLDLLEKISHMAWHDALTGLPNRRLFEDRVDQELVRSRRVGEAVCMFFVDLDHFKTVNDTLGHAAGDELIQEVSDRLVDTVRSQDTVARVGGDEFAILLPGLADQLDIDQLAERTLEAIAEPFVLSGEEVRTTASIGIAVAPEHGDTYDELLSRADEAMYRVKSRGRNAFQMYSPAPEGIQEPAELDQRTLYRDLVHALGSDQFFLVYQPYVDLRTTEVVGVEALLRWNHPEHGVLQPDSFVPLAERSDAIVALDTWVLEECCAQAGRWREAGLPAVRLSVNLASRDLEDPDYATTIARILSAHGIEPERLELDVTGRVVVDEEGNALANIERLRRLGVRFTADDFGTANSSLTRIGAFPINTLKIDRSFVQVLSPGGDGDDLVSAIVQMADRLGLECVAEGVETSLQSRVLLQRGCTTGQGFFLCPPLTAGELEAALTVVGQPAGEADAQRVVGRISDDDGLAEA